MKRLFLSLGLSVTILMSVSFAQTMQKKSLAPVSASTTMVSAKMQQSKYLNQKIAEKLGIDEFKKQAATPVKNLKPAIKHVATYASANPEKVMVKLVAGKCWEDGSGFQVLFDKDAHLCDTGFYGGLQQDKIREYYDAADFKIPADASPVIGETSVLDFESDSAEIDPGVYDVLVINPSESVEGVHVYITGGNSILDNFEFIKGFTYVFKLDMAGMGDLCTLVGPYDLTAEALVLPTLSCETGTEVDVRLTVANSGTADVENFEVWYYVADVTDTNFVPDTIRQTISAKLEAGKSETYVFTSKIEEIKEDSLYVVYAGVTLLQGEINENDNATVGCFIKKAALTSLPYEFDLSKYDFVPGTPDAWVFGETEDGSYVAEANFEPGVPLVSGCFELEGGKVYRLSYDYWAGMVLFVWPFPEDYHIGFGLTSQLMSEWETVFEVEEALAEDWTAADVLLKPKTTGTYALYFSADYQGLMGLRNITITEVADKDARLNAFNPGMARLMPVKQANGKFIATVNVENRGKLSMDATVEVTMNGTAVGSANIQNVVSGAVEDVDIELTVSGLKAGDKPKFVATVNFEGEGEAELKDNTKELEIEVSDYVMAYDYVADDMYTMDYSIGAQSPIGCGIPFTLLVKDTLTAVSLGWCETSVDVPVGITIHKWNATDQELGDLIYETEVRRGLEAGQREYKVPSIILEAGEYMISALQTTSSSYGLIVDGMIPGVGLYVTTATPVNHQENLGTPAIRAVFGPDAKPMAKDVFVQEITKPKALGLFAENQEIVAKISNQGYEAVEAPLNLMVNGKVVNTKNVEIAAYGSAEVSFIADLSAPNTEYVLTVFSALEGDADVSNDTCTKTVRSMAPANPFVMDFEYCEDFSIDGFNPAWKTVDVDAEATYGFSGISFPHTGEAFAFIAFNPEEVGLTEEGTMVPHSGDRLGASFASYAGVNNDWLISPKLKITAGKEYMKFFVKSYVEDYGLEKYNVLISTTNDNIESFTQIGETREAPAEDWEEVSIDLKEYSGKEVYLAIQCVSEDAFIFMIDDITICDGVANENLARLETQLSVYPNPAKEMITIHAQDAVINQVAIFNVSGMMVYQSKTLNTADYRYSVKGLNAGIYFARVTTEQGTAVIKFIVR